VKVVGNVAPRVAVVGAAVMGMAAAGMVGAQAAEVIVGSPVVLVVGDPSALTAGDAAVQADLNETVTPVTRQRTSRPGWARTVVTAVAALAAISAATSSAAAGASAPAAADELRPRVELISATLEGRPANDVRSAAASVDGCRILFSTETQVLVPGAPQSDDKDAVYIRGRDSNRTRLVSSDSAGVPGKGSYGGIISGNGRYISMVSDSSNLTPPGTDSNRWLLRKDLRTGRLETARMPDGTGPAAGLPVMGIDMRGITADGRLTIGSVWYQPADHGPGYMRIAAYDWVTRRWTMLNSYGFYRVVSSISADGRYIAYVAANSSDGSRELYLLDRTTGTTRHVSSRPRRAGRRRNFSPCSAATATHIHHLVLASRDLPPQYPRPAHQRPVRRQLATRHPGSAE
jgi:hypothetical protein